MMLVFAVTFAVIIIAQLFLFKNRPNPQQQPKAVPAEATQGSKPGPNALSSAGPTASKAPGKAAAQRGQDCGRFENRERRDRDRRRE